MVIALAGRRVDSDDATEPRFPLQNVEKVHLRVGEAFTKNAAATLVSSAACGADLIALCEAGKLGLRRRVVLPFDRKSFRESSVTDRSGDWGRIYDTILDRVQAAGDLVIVGSEVGDEAYSAANFAILDEAVVLGRKNGEAVSALLVWDGVSRGLRDLTEEFGNEARRRGLPVIETSTL